MKHNFKVGDKVRIKPYKAVEDHMGILERDWRNYDGRIYEIKYTNSCSVQFETNGFYWPLEALEPVCDKRELIVYSKGPETVAIEKVNGKMVKKAVAKCSPEDEYKWETGRDLALERLLKEEKPEEKPFYNGKVVCVDAVNNKEIYILGKIYQFENGYICSESGFKKHYHPVRSFEEWAAWSSSKWLEIVE